MRKVLAIVTSAIMRVMLRGGRYRDRNAHVDERYLEIVLLCKLSRLKSQIQIANHSLHHWFLAQIVIVVCSSIH